MTEWADTWQIQYNVDKCEVIHFGGKNRKEDYYLNGGSLGKGEVHRDLDFAEGWHAGTAGGEES